MSKEKKTVSSLESMSTHKTRPSVSRCKSRAAALLAVSAKLAAELARPIERIAELVHGLPAPPLAELITIEKILGGGAKTLIETVTNSNRLGKCRMIDGDGRFIYRGTKK